MPTIPNLVEFFSFYFKFCYSDRNFISPLFALHSWMSAIERHELSTLNTDELMQCTSLSRPCYAGGKSNSHTAMVLVFLGLGRRVMPGHWSALNIHDLAASWVAGWFTEGGKVTASVTAHNVACELLWLRCGAILEYINRVRLDGMICIKMSNKSDKLAKKTTCDAKAQKQLQCSVPVHKAVANRLLSCILHGFCRALFYRETAIVFVQKSSKSCLPEAFCEAQNAPQWKLAGASHRTDPTRAAYSAPLDPSTSWIITYHPFRPPSHLVITF